MRIREGDPLEIFVSNEGEVIFKKYSLMGGVDEFAAQLCDTLSKSTGTSVAVTDRYCATIAAPIISEGDALGLVVFIGTEGESAAGETEYKLAQAIAGFLGKHMES